MKKNIETKKTIIYISIINILQIVSIAIITFYVLIKTNFEIVHYERFGYF